MAIFDIFKKKKQGEKEKKVKEVKEKARVKKAPEAAETPKVVKEEQKEGPKKQIISKKRKKANLAYQVLKSPRITEKATFLSKNNKYVFEVFPKANKIEIKKAVEDLYGVNVTKVRIIKMPRKKIRVGRISGWKKGYKKAIVKIKEGQKIEALPR